MSDPSSAAGLLGRVLGLQRSTPVYATSSFSEWLPSGGPPLWPPSAQAGLVLIDTADIRDRHTHAELRPTLVTQHQAAFILGRAAPHGVLRRLSLRRILRRRQDRQTSSQIEQSLGIPREGVFVSRLGFQDESGIPSEFSVSQPGAGGGTALLVTRAPAFSGGLWSALAERLADSPCGVTELQLRTRGAAVLLLKGARCDYVVRIVDDAKLRPVVMRNHDSLSSLRSELGGDPELLDKLPEPLAALEHEGALVLVETRLPGTLAWRVDRGGIGARAYGDAVAFLERMRRATLQAPVHGVDDLMRTDLQRASSSQVPGHAVRDLLLDELAASTAALRDVRVTPGTSHGDFGFGNVLVDETTGALTGVIDWDTARAADVPGIDRVNLEIQLARGRHSLDFADAVRRAHETGAIEAALSPIAGEAGVRPLFGLAVCRYIIRSFTYPAVYAGEAPAFERALEWLAGRGRDRVPGVFGK
ncbi:MAG TPA: aminoglycoside phosphotransferase family protein [Longimicrobiales bacterium]